MPLFFWLFFEDDGICDDVHIMMKRVMIFVMADVGNATAVCLSVCHIFIHMGEYVPLYTYRQYVQ